MSDTAGAADGELLEFLGSVDGEGEGWGDYLEDTDVRRVAASPPPAVPTPAPSSQAALPPRPATSAVRATAASIPPPARAPQPGSQP